VRDINELRDSFALKKESNREACDKFTFMKHNLLRKKSKIEMFALKTFIPSPQ